MKLKKHNNSLMIVALFIESNVLLLKLLLD